MALKFYPAKHNSFILAIAKLGNALDLFWHNRVAIEPESLSILTAIPENAGIILVANHSDENDIKLCIDLARRSNRHFTFMINAEAFEEWHGFAGWLLQRLGGFSVERGCTDQAALNYADHVITTGNTILVMFPEGEIYYLNDLVQPFKTGAVHIGLQALSKANVSSADKRTIYIIPVAIKYSYHKNILVKLQKKIRKIEKRLSLQNYFLPLQEQLIHILAHVLKRPTILSQTETISSQLTRLTRTIEEARATLIEKIELKYNELPSTQHLSLSARAQKLIFFLRNQLHTQKHLPRETRAQMKRDLTDSKRTIHMAGWQPEYIDFDPSEERLAETIIKLEREVFHKKRPKPLGNRKVRIRLGQPLDLSPYVSEYATHPSAVSHHIAENLRNTIQQLIKRST